jgi:hypothetical protein
MNVNTLLYARQAVFKNRRVIEGLENRSVQQLNAMDRRLANQRHHDEGHCQKHGAW